MASYNHITVVGNLTRDPELRYSAAGTPICRLGLATNHKYKDREEVCFLDVTVFGAQGEAVSQHLHKGSQCLVDGRLAQETWESQDGQKRSKHVVIAERVVFLDRKGDAPAASGQEARPAPQAAATKAPEASAPEVFEDDDIPF